MAVFRRVFAALLVLLAATPAAATRDGYVTRGAALRLYQNGLDLLTQLAPEFIDPNPIVDSYPGMELGSASCLLDSIKFGIRTVNYTIPIDARSITLDFMDGDKLGGDIVLEATVTTEAYSRGCLINEDIPIYAHGLTGYLEVTVGVVNNAIQVISVDEFEIRDVWDLQVDGGWIESLVEIFGFDVEGEIEKAIKKEGKKAVEDAIPDLINDMLKEYVALDLDFVGMNFRIQPEDFPIDRFGGTLLANSGVDADPVDACIPANTEPGFPAPSNGKPDDEYEGVYAAIGAGQGFMEDLLWAVWESGLLCFEDTFDLGDLLSDVGVSGTANLKVLPLAAPGFEMPPPGTLTPTITVTDLSIVLDMIVDGQAAGALTVNTDGRLVADIELSNDNALVLVVKEIFLENTTIEYDSQIIPLEQTEIDALVNEVLMPLYQEQIGALPLLDTVLSFEGIFVRVLDIERVQDYLVIYLALARPPGDDSVPPTTYIDRIGGRNPTQPGVDLTFGMAPIAVLYHAADDLSQYDAFITYEWRLDGGAWEDVGYSKSVELENLSDGTHKFFVRSRDFAGNLDTTGDQIDFDVDGSAPDTVIVSGPPEFTNEYMAEFSWDGSDDRGGDLTFQFKMDDEEWGPNYVARSAIVGLSEAGPHTIEVRAMDSVGNPDPSPANTSFIADYNAPETLFAATPGEWASATTLIFELGADDDFTPADRMEYRYQLVKFGGDPGPCAADWTDYELGATVDLTSCPIYEGEWIFRAQVRDGAGNEDLTPEDFHFKTDLTGPETELTADPGDEVTGARATFEYIGTDNFTAEALLKFSWRAFPAGQGDGVDWTAPSSAKIAVATDLTPGRWTFETRAVDLASNVDDTPAAHSFDVFASTDQIPPVVTIVKGPSGVWNDTQAVFEWTVTDDETAQGNIECRHRLLPLPWTTTAVYTSATVSGLEDGKSYRFEVQCFDEGGNIGAASRQFDVDIEAEIPDADVDVDTDADGDVDTDVDTDTDADGDDDRRREYTGGFLPKNDGCGCGAAQGGGIGWVGLLGLLGFALRRRRR